MTKLKPCPFCKKEEPQVYNTYRWRFFGYVWWVECKCGARGPRILDNEEGLDRTEEAIAAWNNR